MDAKTFFETVVAMRKAQRDYKQTRSNESLRYASDLERKIDVEIKRVQMLLREQQCPRLEL